MGFHLPELLSMYQFIRGEEVCFCTVKVCPTLDGSVRNHNARIFLVLRLWHEDYNTTLWANNTEKIKPHQPFSCPRQGEEGTNKTIPEEANTDFCWRRWRMMFGEKEKKKKNNLTLNARVIKCPKNAQGRGVCKVLVTSEWPDPSPVRWVRHGRFLRLMAVRGRGITKSGGSNDSTTIRWFARKLAPGLPALTRGLNHLHSSFVFLHEKKNKVFQVLIPKTDFPVLLHGSEDMMWLFTDDRSEVLKW
jgi:hypothetical protein